MASDAVTLIKSDHRLMEALFERLKDPSEDRASLLKEVVARLSAHAWAEEERVYPVLIRTKPAEEGQVYHGVEEHHEAEELLHKLQETDPNGPEFDTVLEEFVSAVRHHVEEEETSILPELAKATDAERLEQLGAAFEERRMEVLAAHGIAANSGRGGNGGNAAEGSTEVSKLSRDDLYQAAKEADIPGRSKMTKDELAEAVREQR